MAVPDYQAFMRPMLAAVRDGALGIREASEKAADLLGLTDSEKQELLRSGNKQIYYDRAQWAGTYLVKAGLLKRPRRAVIEITPDGISAVDDPHANIDNTYLSQFDSFQNFVAPTETTKSGSVRQKITPSIAAGLATPQDQISAAINEIDAALGSEIIERVLLLHPDAFEQLIIDLMNGMGYGAGGESHRIGRAGDGGVDGVISEDKLGLDVVYLQAKRYALENAIGPEQIRGFIGALSIRRASKGVFVTTSRFTASAKEEAKMSGQRVILIDGKRLATLMIQYGVGVRVTDTVLIKEIDLNYFDDF